jgi:phosphatidylglycerol lysyltransferase
VSARKPARVANDFEGDAARNGETVCYFGAEARLRACIGIREPLARIARAQPVWRPAEWANIVSQNSSIRAQVNRARNKASMIRNGGRKANNNTQLDECLHSWLATKGLPPLHFVVEPETLAAWKIDAFSLRNEREGEAFLVLSPIPERNGWLTEQFPHRPGAPNGTVELNDGRRIFAVLAKDGCEYVTLGLSPLSKRAKIKPFDKSFLAAIPARMDAENTPNGSINSTGLDRFKSKLCRRTLGTGFCYFKRKGILGPARFMLTLRHLAETRADLDDVQRNNKSRSHRASMA